MDALWKCCCSGRKYSSNYLVELTVCSQIKLVSILSKSKNGNWLCKNLCELVWCCRFCIEKYFCRYLYNNFELFDFFYKGWFGWVSSAKVVHSMISSLSGIKGYLLMLIPRYSSRAKDPTDCLIRCLRWFSTLRTLLARESRISRTDRRARS